MSSDDKPPRILVEGGPFWRRTRYTLWFLLGCIVGIVVAFILAFHAIQQSRLQSCLDTNMRNRATVIALEKDLKGAHVTEIERKQSLAFTITLINALAPKKNCRRVIK